ncbi:hypothetical protein [Solimonas terrae]|uniref:2TM domain-containing protein n=1 Tax=Solimonas terrae TaxID=1396819 RepID=A0A6M2BNP8_9GAMM|nr:hypothetical protein [Solimonas terrae]NGY04262.1 hypothetical protein [Solimonas terrae]
MSDNVPSPVFSGSPRRYRRLALLLGIGSHALLYGGMVLIEWVWHGRAWIVGSGPIAFTAVSALLLTLLGYHSLMFVDAQYPPAARRSRHDRGPSP